MTNVVYLDNNATTKVDPRVLEAMLPYFSDYYGNPSSMHSFGGGVAANIRTAREHLARLIGASPDEIVFTSCGTESDSTAIRAAIGSDPTKRHLVTSRVEHRRSEPSETLSKRATAAPSCRWTERGTGLDYFYDSPMMTPPLCSEGEQRDRRSSLRRFPAGSRARHRLHTDAVRQTDRPWQTGVDMLSLSGHKSMRLGIGALYIRKGTKFFPFDRGPPGKAAVRNGEHGRHHRASRAAELANSARRHTISA
jgi:cysteine desulfurase